MDDPGRLTVYLLWAFGSVVAWGAVFVNALRDYRIMRDSRALRELIADFALLLVALASAFSIVMLLIGQNIPGLRGFSLAVALGAFLAAGIVAATVKRRP